MSVDTSSHHDATNGLPRIAGFRLLRVIGQGGMSTVYLGEQESLAREVAIKVMLPEALADEVSRRRFENEVRTIARLEHPNIVGIHEVGRTADGLPYYAMPYLARGHLGQRISEQDGRTHDQARVIAIAAHAALGARLRARARRRASRRQGGERAVRRCRAAAAGRLRHRLAQGHRPARHRCRAWRSAAPPTWRRNRRAARTSTAAPTCTASACWPGKCSPAACRTRPPMRCRWR